MFDTLPLTAKGSRAMPTPSSAPVVDAVPHVHVPIPKGEAAVGPGVNDVDVNDADVDGARYAWAEDRWRHEDYEDWQAGADGLSIEEWADYAAEMVVPSALAQVGYTLGNLPLPVGVAKALMAVISCAVSHAESDVAGDCDLGDAQVLDAAAGARVVSGFADSVVVTAAGSLAQRAGRELLGRKGVTDPADLSETARDRWRARTKSVVAAELSTLTGWGVQDCHIRVAVALAPTAGVGLAREALTRGATDWRAVSAFWQRCRAMDVNDAARVDHGTFGPYLGGAQVDGVDGDEAEDHETVDLDVAREPWPVFHRRLCLEVAKVESRDAEAARARRRAAQKTRDVRGELCDDGLGSFTVTGPTTSIVAALERIETIARRARKAGDPRPLNHLRSDTAMALLVHGILPLTTAGTSVGTSTETGTSTGWGPRECTGQGSRSATRAEGHNGTEAEAEAGAEGPLLGMSEDLSRLVAGLPDAHVDVIVPIDTLAPDTDQEVGVAEIPGHAFVSGEYAREVIASPGTVLHRLLTDPVDGRAVERSVVAYRPDKEMVEHVRAVDRFCRAPGCLSPASRCELDHEVPFGTPGGLTSITNLNLKHPRHHQFKTAKFWATAMDESRHVTWTTLFGKVYRTRAHNYTQYICDNTPGGCNERATETTNGRCPEERPDGQSRGLANIHDPDLRDQLIYAALCSRLGQDTWLEAVDDYQDHPDADVSGPPLAVFHRGTHQRRRGAPPNQSSVIELLERAATGATLVSSEPVATPEEFPPF